MPTAAAAPRPELLGLLSACRESPLDDAPRLVLADWLDEHGEPDRARLVRLQIDRSRQPGSEPDYVVDLLPDDEGELAARNQGWLSPYAGCGRAWLRRGLVTLSTSARSLGSTRFVRLLKKEAWAWVDEVCLRDLDKVTVKLLAARPELGAVGGLDVSYSRVKVAGWRALAKLPWLREVARLDLASCWMGQKGLEALAAVPFARLPAPRPSPRRRGWPAGCVTSTWDGTCWATRAPRRSPRRGACGRSSGWASAATASARPAWRRCWRRRSSPGCATWTSTATRSRPPAAGSSPAPGSARWSR
jgi:uncharacterized protein (TIGR02996 family)